MIKATSIFFVYLFIKQCQFNEQNEFYFYEVDQKVRGYASKLWMA